MANKSKLFSSRSRSHNVIEHWPNVLSLIHH